VSVFIDTAVIMYAAGGPHPLRDSCRRIISGIGDGEIDGVTSASTVRMTESRGNVGGEG